MWFRRDLRLSDNPALLAAVGAFDDVQADVVPLFVLDPALWNPAGPPRRAYLLRSLAALDERLGGALQRRRGDPVAEVVAVARAAKADEVHCAADYGPYGSARDTAVEKALAAHGIELVRTGSPYAVAPGRVLTKAGEPYSVFTPFFRAWLAHGWRGPAPAPGEVSYVKPLADHDFPREPDLDGLALCAAGEEAARRRWTRFLESRLPAYAADRDRPAVPGTSGLSTALKYGEIHPRTLLTDLEGVSAERVRAGADTYRKELCWREFHADVLWHRPETARTYLREEFARMRYDEPGEAFEAWCAGRTGFPLVDAGMRQLLAEGWMHNRVRMVVASFLVKDLHLEWQHGARWFMRWLRDGDLASNQHNWQWVAGCGTDAAPYFRVFNPETQAAKFDPNGTYVRAYVRELRHLPGAAALTPWEADGGYSRGYPHRIVDHAEERREALLRLEEARVEELRAP
jgi:deoxyribodipyrimidine photo-lyase